MSDLFSRLSRRRFLVSAGISAVGAIALKGCTSPSASTDSPATAVSPIAATDEAALYEAAKKEGRLVVYSVFFTQDILNEIGAAFTAKYPGITFEGTRNTASDLFQKITQEIQAGLKVTDVFGTTDIGQMLELRKQNQLLQFEPADKSAVVEAYRNLDPENYYQPGAYIPLIIAYNSQRIGAADLPKSWKDLTLDKYKDAIATGSGAASGQVGTWALAMQNLYGWDDYFGKFNALNPKLGRSINDVMPVLVSGERALGISTLGQALHRKAKGDPIEVVYPEEGAVVVVGPYGILKNSPHPHAARLFLNFLMGEEYSNLVAKHYEQPLRSNITIPNGKTISEMKTISLKPDEIQKGLPDIVSKWRNKFGA
ncbi:MAG: extracellular solute-binding protein [Oculatellaceae cyanobacterium Prado106]|jgi:iron(III) transport system substrate-binding protein|nr:extracellular solute-binding protein [Oculatellaceae cyanobacterium Prado106]